LDLYARRPDPALVETVGHAVSEAGIAPSSLCLQITEGFVLRDAEAANETLRALKELGVLIGMEDFGSSQSSLGALKRFPLDLVKVERSFVSGLGEESTEANGTVGEDVAVVGAMISVAQALGLLTVADGVEAREQVELLKSLGCEVGQGQYFARARPSEAISELLGATASRPAAA
jgi:EAL domain-containing protein (putative c-di-GMP-specific phosphodiesterase class I)